MPILQLNLLGHSQFYVDDAPKELKSAKAAALLGFLAATAEPQTRTHLTDILWPDSLPEAARKNLRNALWSIRRELGEDWVASDGDRLGIAPQVRCDLWQFESIVADLDAASATELASAMALYRGPFLDGLLVQDAPEFELWLVDQQAYLTQRYLRLLEKLVVLYRSEGDWAALEKVAQRALTADNLHEPMHRALMEAYANQGNRSEALRRYDHLQRILQQELSVEPLPETQALRAAILDGSHQEAISQPVERARTVVIAPASQRTALIGREAQLAALGRTNEQVMTSGARISLLMGEMGIGKTSLWRTWAASLGSDAGIYTTRALESTQNLPYAPLVALFGQNRRLRKLLQTPDLLPSVWLNELHLLVPDLSSSQTVVAIPTSSDPNEERRRLFEAMVQVMLLVGNRPLTLFIDDVHWADYATIDWLSYLIERLRDEPLHLVVAYRPADASPKLVHLAATWLRQGVAAQIPLPRLSLAEAAELLGEEDEASSRLQEIYGQSAGNPYFLVELSRNPEAGLPSGLSALLRARINQLSDASRQLLQAASILEPAFDFPLLRRVSGRSEEECLDAIDELLLAGILTEQPQHFEFNHPLVAAIVRQDLSLARRSFLHRRAAEALMVQSGGKDKSLTAQLARHFAGAGQHLLAAEYAVQTARQAMQVGATAEADAWYRQALAWDEQPETWLELGQALNFSSDLDAARKALRKALDDFTRRGDFEQSARAQLGMADSYLPSGQGDSAVQWARRVLDSEAQLSPQTIAHAHFMMAAGGLQSGMALAEVEAHLLQASELAEAHEMLPMAARSQFELGNALAQRGNLAEAILAYERSLDLATRAGEPPLQVLAHNNLAFHMMLVGDLTPATEHLQRGLAMAAEFGMYAAFQYLYSTASEIAIAAGRWDEAEVYLQKALAEAEQFQNRQHIANVRANMGLLAREQGNLAEAILLLETARDMLLDGRQSQHLLIKTELWMAEVYLRRGELSAANSALQQAEARLAGDERQGLSAWADRIRQQIEAGVASD
ncbi:MAG: AAA family ATPase [Caldilineales bacterium]|nr:AAA family ATPase [Caldilineales bacterium]